MQPTLPPALALLLTVAAPQPTPSGRIDAGGGITFQFPRGFTVEVEASEEGTVHAATRPDGEVAISAAVLTGVNELACEGEEQAALGLRPFRTGRGLRACAATAAAEAEDGSGPLALSLALVEAGPAVVTVAARAPGEAEAAALARSVADSVAFDPGRASRDRPGGWGRLDLPRADPRLVGCYESFREIWMPSHTAASRTRSRCLEDDGTFREASGFSARFGVLGEEGGAAAGGGATGTWSFDGETLSLVYDDGEEQEGRVELGESGFIVDGVEIWARR